MDPAAALRAFAAVFPAELPDKTMIATLVLVAHHRRALPVWCGAALAFTVHVVVAVTAGQFLRLLPDTGLTLVTAALFAVGAALLWRESGDRGAATTSDADAAAAPGDAVGRGTSPIDAGGAPDAEGPPAPTGGGEVAAGRAGHGHEGAGTGDGVGPRSAGAPTTALAAFAGSFGVVGLAEAGDLTQLATAGMAASSDAPVAVGVGALAALWLVAGLAVTLGRRLADRLPVALLQRGAAAVFAALAVAAVVSLL